MVIERHTVKFKIDQPEKYRNWTLSGDHVKQIKACGGDLIMLAETENGIWNMVIDVNKNHEKHNDLIHICTRNGFTFELMGVPEIQVLGVTEIVSEIKEVINA
tara:strand:+ start:9772 stop:10080 length:309 start_codon:yes stop_codon:yes gene_type:complete